MTYSAPSFSNHCLENLEFKCTPHRPCIYFKIDYTCQEAVPLPHTQSVRTKRARRTGRSIYSLDSATIVLVLVVPAGTEIGKIVRRKRTERGKARKAGKEISKRKSWTVYRNEATVVHARGIVLRRKPRPKRIGFARCRREGSLPSSWR